MLNDRGIRRLRKDGFAHFLRTGSYPPEQPADAPELKYNHNHDPQNGQFASGPGYSGGDRVSIDLRTGAVRHAASRVRVPIDPPKPFKPSPPVQGAVRLPRGGVRIPIDPPKPDTRPQSVRSFKTASNVVIVPEHEPKIEAMAKDYKQATGDTLYVVSSRRTNAGQAAAMYDKFKDGSNGSDYRQKQALKEIRDAYDAGNKARQSRTDTIKAMTAVIDRQVKRGVYISAHMVGRGVDIRMVSKTNKRHLEAAALRHGGRYHPEGFPPHIHVEFPVIRKPEKRGVRSKVLSASGA